MLLSSKFGSLRNSLLFHSVILVNHSEKKNLIPFSFTTGKLYGNVEYVEERHRHRYEVNPTLVKQFEEKGLAFVGQDVDGERMEILELQGRFT